MAIYQINILTATGGAFSETFTPRAGSFRQYRYVPHATTPVDTGGDLDVTGAQTGFVYVNQDNIGTTAFQKLPRYATADETGTASLYAAGGEPVEGVMAVAEPITVAIANGGDAKKGTLYIWVD
jgi:hypothetical protein